MRGRTSQQISTFSVIPIDSWIEAEHPLRSMAALVEPVLESLSPEFDAIYSTTGGPSIPPEQLLKALVLQVLHTLRTKGQLLEHLRFNYRRRPSVEDARGGQAYETKDFVGVCGAFHMTAQVAQNTGRCGGSAIDWRTTRNTG